MKPLVKLVIYTPVSHADEIRQVLGEAGAGNIGNYDFCSFSTRGIGRFRGNEKSNPAIGKPGEIEEVEEERIETICYKEDAAQILADVKAVHPYEEPAMDVYALEDQKALKD